MNSYQKLKQENEALKRKLHEAELDIRALVMEPESYRATVTRLSVEQTNNLQEAFMFGKRQSIL